MPRTSKLRKAEKRTDVCWALSTTVQNTRSDLGTLSSCIVFGAVVIRSWAEVCEKTFGGVDPSDLVPWRVLAGVGIQQARKGYVATGTCAVSLLGAMVCIYIHVYVQPWWTVPVGPRALLAPWDATRQLASSTGGRLVCPSCASSMTRGELLQLQAPAPAPAPSTYNTSIGTSRVNHQF